MGVLRDLFVFLFGPSQRSSYWDDYPVGISLSKYWLIVRDEKFKGHYSVSPDGLWIVAYCDEDLDGKGGLRFEGSGKVMLVAENPRKIFCRVNIVERPSGASVANNGRFAINDACFGFAGQGLARVFEASGGEIFQRRYLSSIRVLKISRCGRYLLVVTEPGRVDVDSSRLDLIDIDKKRIILTRQPGFDGIVDYEFQVDSCGEFFGFEVVLTNSEKCILSYNEGSLDERFYVEAGEKIKREFLTKMNRENKRNKK